MLMFPEFMAFSSGGATCSGLAKGNCLHQCSPASASSSVALLAGDRSKPLKKLGGGGRSDVSGTASSHWCFLVSFSCDGGGPGGGAA